MNGPGDVIVDLAERLVDRVGHADWVSFQKSGTDATTLCVTAAHVRETAQQILGPVEL